MWLFVPIICAERLESAVASHLSSCFGPFLGDGWCSGHFGAESLGLLPEENPSRRAVYLFIPALGEARKPCTKSCLKMTVIPE